MKDFKTLELGTFDLPKGRGLFILRAMRAAGKRVMDLRSVVVTLKP